MGSHSLDTLRWIFQDEVKRVCARVSMEDARRTAIAILAIMESAEKGMPVEVHYD